LRETAKYGPEHASGLPPEFVVTFDPADDKKYLTVVADLTPSERAGLGRALLTEREKMGSREGGFS
jgi:hypothetical protein